jgi:hypothetical protein
MGRESTSKWAPSALAGQVTIRSRSGRRHELIVALDPTEDASALGTDVLGRDRAKLRYFLLERHEPRR